MINVSLDHIFTKLLVATFILTICFIFAKQSSAKVDLGDAFLIYTFDEGDGDIVEDRSGNGNNGVIAGGYEWVDGRNGSGLELNGSSGQIVSATANGVGPTAFTECLWVKFANLNVENQFGYISCKGTANARYFYFSSWSSVGAPHDSMHAGTLDAAGNWGRGISTGRLFDTDEWYFAAAVVDTENGFIKVYSNGDMVIQQVIPTGDTPGEPTQIWVGASPEAYQWIGGVIDDVAFFNVALSEDDLKSIMDNGIMESGAVDYAGKLSATWAQVKM
jgi:hypothetical protein